MVCILLALKLFEICKFSKKHIFKSIPERIMGYTLKHSLHIADQSFDKENHAEEYNLSAI